MQNKAVKKAFSMIDWWINYWLESCSEGSFAESKIKNGLAISTWKDLNPQNGV